MPSEESYKKIEGVWKDFRIRRVEPKDYPAVLDHITKYFSRDEPTAKLLGWSPELAEDLNGVVTLFLPDGMSFLCEHIPTGEIAALRITFNHKPGMSFDGLEFKSESVKLGMKLLHIVEALADVQNRFGIDTWAEFFVASTHPNYRCLGLAGELYDRSLEFLKAEGFKHAVVVCTSPYTRKATKKRGFEELARFDYKNFNGFDGKPAFKEEDLTPEHFSLFMIKTLVN